MKHSTVALSGLALMALTAIPVRGEEPSPPPDSVVVLPEVYSLPDTVRIVGERIAIDPLRVPVAATLLRSEDWETGRLAALDEALAQVPGVLAQSRSGAQDVRVMIRGFGARGAGDRSNAGTTRGIRVTLDGFPITEPDGRTSFDLADLGLLDAVRVVRSNTSGLYGPASGGLIDLYSTSRYTDSYLEAATEFGSFGYARQRVRLGLVKDVSRINLSISNSNFDGWREQSGGSQTTVLASIQADPSPRTALGFFLSGTHNEQRQPGALTVEEFAADPRQGNAAYVSQNARRDNQIGRVGTKLEQRFGGGQVLRVGAFVEPKHIERSERNRYRDFDRVHTGGSVEYTRPLSLGSTSMTLTAGLDDAFQDGDVHFYTLGPGGTQGTDLVSDQREAINTFGVFADVNTSLSPRWNLTTGARWDFVHYISEDNLAPDLSATMTLDRVSPRATLAFKAGEKHTLYGALSSGIENPAFNEVDPPAPFDTLTSLNPLLDPAYSMTMEIGAKGNLHFGRGFDTFAYDVALYTLSVNNDIVPWDNGAFYTTAGESRRSGIEMGLSAGTDYGLSARVSTTLTRSRYVDYVTGVPGEDGNLVTVRYDGHESAGIPSFVSSLTLRYEHAAGPFVEGTGHRVGSYYANDANTDVVEAYHVFDMTAGTTHRISRAEVTVFASAKNLTDEKYVASAYINGVDGKYLEPGMERNFHVGIQLRAIGQER